MLQRWKHVFSYAVFFIRNQRKGTGQVYSVQWSVASTAVPPWQSCTRTHWHFQSLVVSNSIISRIRCNTSTKISPKVRNTTIHKLLHVSTLRWRYTCGLGDRNTLSGGGKCMDSGKHSVVVLACLFIFSLHWLTLKKTCSKFHHTSDC